MKRWKDITLVTLIIISVLLFSRIWSGETIISVIKNSSIFGRGIYTGEPTAFAVEDIISPERIIVTGSGKRLTLFRTRDGYDDVLESVCAAAEKTEIKEDEVLNGEAHEVEAALKFRSVLVDFANAYDSTLIEKLGIPLPEGEYTDIVFAPSSSLGVNSFMYVTDKNGRIYKIPMKEDGGFDSVIEQSISQVKDGNNPFAFELGFDKVKTEAEISSGVSLDSDIVMGLTETEAEGIEISRAGHGVSEKTVSALLEAFAFNVNTTRRYVDKDDVIVLVDNKATLKIYPSYLIEYTSENGGYELYEAGGDGSAVNALGGIYTVLGAVGRAFDMGGITVSAASDIEKSFPAEKELLFDYYAGGMPVLINDAGGVSHGISIKINDGVITSYRQYICNAEAADESIHTESMISALDRLYEKFAGEKEVKIDNMFMAYTADGTLSSGGVRWCVKTGNDIIVID